MTFKHYIKNLYIRIFRAEKTKYKIVSIGSGCDIKLFMINPLLPHYQTEFFDFLWNFDGGLKTVKNIIKDNFDGFSNAEDYYFGLHPKWDSSLNLELKENQVSLQWHEKDISYNIPHKYPEIAFMHYSDISWVEKTYPKRINRFRKFLNSSNIYFVYYRQYDEPINSTYINEKDYDLDSKLNFWIEETIEFSNFLKNVNQNIKVLSLFALPHDFDQNIQREYKFPDIPKNIIFDFTFYKDLEPEDHDPIKVEMKRIFNKHLAK